MDRNRPRYADLAVRPQIIRNAPLLTFVLRGDPGALRRCVPVDLPVHPDGRVILNMWFQPDPHETSGFGEPGPMGVTYLAAEIDGEQGADSEGVSRFPGRFWMQHWSSSDAARLYAKRASGLDIRPGETRFDPVDGAIRATLRLDGKTVITARARVGTDKLRTVSGHSIYYGERDREAGGREVARYEIPWISDVFDAGEPSVGFTFDSAEPARRVVANGAQAVIAATFRRITLVPYLAQTVLGRVRADR